MRIVLLGATGFVGHHLLPRLSAAGHSCLALSRYRMAVRELSVIPGVELREADVYDADTLAECLHGADAAINMVGILNESGRSGKGFHKAHVELAERVIAGCRTAGVRRFMQVSALNAGHGKSHYLISKGEAEQLVHAASDLDATILQPSVIFGEGDAFFNRFAALMKFTPVLPLACPDARLQPVWVGDVTEAITAALADPATVGKTLVLVGPRDYSLHELVTLTACIGGSSCRIVSLPDSLSRLQARIMDFVPGKPFSTDNYLSLQTDNTSEVNSLPALGIEPRSVEGVLPGMLGVSARQVRLDGFRKRVQH
ncbi:MAG: complex I NDUFA9 subunit family protein [Lysobacterales bacterium]